MGKIIEIQEKQEKKKNETKQREKEQKEVERAQELIINFFDEAFEILTDSRLWWLYNTLHTNMELFWRSLATKGIESPQWVSERMTAEAEARLKACKAVKISTKEKGTQATKIIAARRKEKALHRANGNKDKRG